MNAYERKQQAWVETGNRIKQLEAANERLRKLCGKVWKSEVPKIFLRLDDGHFIRQNMDVLEKYSKHRKNLEQRLKAEGVGK